jgi:hypothetical protein
MAMRVKLLLAVLVSFTAEIGGTVATIHVGAGCEVVGLASGRVTGKEPFFHGKDLPVTGYQRY